MNKLTRMASLILVTIGLASPIESLCQVDFYLFGGPQAVSARYTIRNAKQPTEAKFGFTLGVSAKIPFEEQLYFVPAINYSRKGYKVTLNTSSYPPDTRALNNDVSINTLDFAPLLQFDFSKKPSHFFVRGGIAMDFAISGKESYDTSANGGGQVERDMPFTYGDYGRYTGNAIIQAGYETPAMFVNAHYTHGMGSLNNADGGPKIVHRIVGISFGVKLNKKKNGQQG